MSDLTEREEAIIERYRALEHGSEKAIIEEKVKRKTTKLFIKKHEDVYYISGNTIGLDVTLNGRTYHLELEKINKKDTLPVYEIRVYNKELIFQYEIRRYRKYYQTIGRIYSRTKHMF